MAVCNNWGVVVERIMVPWSTSWRYESHWGYQLDRLAREAGHGCGPRCSANARTGPAQRRKESRGPTNMPGPLQYPSSRRLPQRARDPHSWRAALPLVLVTIAAALLLQLAAAPPSQGAFVRARAPRAPGQQLPQERALEGAVGRGRNAGERCNPLGRRHPRSAARWQLRLRGGLQLLDGNEANMCEVETMSKLEQLRNSLDPAEYPPMEVEYNEHDEMIMPPPINLEVPRPRARARVYRLRWSACLERRASPPPAPPAS